MADQQRSEPHRWDPTVQHYAPVSEPMTTPYCLDALAGLDLHLGYACSTWPRNGALATAVARRGASVLAINSSPAMVAFLARRAGEGIS
jgi:hypothetical protein